MRLTLASIAAAGEAITGNDAEEMISSIRAAFAAESEIEHVSVRIRTGFIAVGIFTVAAETARTNSCIRGVLERLGFANYSIRNVPLPEVVLEENSR
ncbi:hypothetical protein AMIS_22290 [Actinoplanes missouriensis 431]|uniref:Uncharacterized protein n=1 Tax=Actinoplanes missouriensis (strain ATCC 14538 / DSM 43046 / CBS 188.64 / JCM 3121 / NBRC 102363 / NCIMB 12654 / NRRL B-3342 / UNCC 431) TaxID=512565 RepID=I0H362_ACTM4|nr:hypothetical protein [Actinoplanes missouriensis]BAL87449.1 hypothetical protein AMIS_22290 [Actinoplanes missouriensis 431]